MKRTPSITERFDQSYAQRGDEECWEWTESTYHNGYGRFSDNGRWYLAHRVSYGLNVAPIPRGMVVMHRCNNKKCVNPFHLDVGTHSENTRDALRDGLRTEYDRRGSSNPKAKLDDEAVKYIRRVIASGEAGRLELARLFGVDPNTISTIVKRQSWKHVA
jgi:hypothetical protein